MRDEPPTEMAATPPPSKVCGNCGLGESPGDQAKGERPRVMVAPDTCSECAGVELHG